MSHRAARVIPDREFRSDPAPDTCLVCEGLAAMEVVWAKAYWRSGRPRPLRRDTEDARRGLVVFRAATTAHPERGVVLMARRSTVASEGTRSSVQTGEWATPSPAGGCSVRAWGRVREEIRDRPMEEW